MATKNAPKPGMVLCLTGTPVLNRPVELVEQIKVLGKMNLFGGEKHFKNRYCGPDFNGWGWTFNGASNLEELNTQMRANFYVRRLKEDVLTELPAKVRAPQFLRLSNVALKTYFKAEADVVAFLKSTKGDKAAAKARQAEALVRLNVLRRLIAEAKINDAIDWAMNFLESGKSLVIFADHKQAQAGMISGLEANGIEVVSILGGMNKNTVEANKARFQAGEVKVIVCSLKAAREGHTLTAASDVLFLELGWTPGGLSQAEDRCHRIGQNDSVTAWYILALNTIDDTMYALIESKRAVCDATANGNEDAEVESVLAGVIASLGG